MVLMAAVNGTYLGVAFEPCDVCRREQVFQCAETVEKHREKLNDEN
jgi:hypothetical protein